MTVLGADPEELESTAQRVLALADNYENANQQIGFWLRRMAWEGAEADRFHAMYQSQMHPQLMAAAVFSREASSELRAQAASQTRVSQDAHSAEWVCGPPLLPVAGTDEADSAGIADTLNDIWNFFKLIPILDTIVGFMDYMIRHYRGLANVLKITPYVVDKVDDLMGISKFVGDFTSKILGTVGIGISLWTLTKDGDLHRWLRQVGHNGR